MTFRIWVAAFAILVSCAGCRKDRPASQNIAANSAGETPGRLPEIDTIENSAQTPATTSHELQVQSPFAKKWVALATQLKTQLKILVVANVDPESLKLLKANFPLLYEVARAQTEDIVDQDKSADRLLLTYFKKLEIENDHLKLLKDLKNAFATIHVFPDSLPIVRIESCDDLLKIKGPDSSEIHRTDGFIPKQIYRLMNDLDCGNLGRVNYDDTFMSPSLVHHFDGNGFAIKNLKLPSVVNSGQLVGTALFAAACRACVLANLRVENADLAAGAIVVGLNRGKVSHVTAQGILRPSQSDFSYGGIAIANYHGTIEYSQADVEMRFFETERGELYQNAFGEFAGLVALNLDGTIVNSRARIKGKVASTVGGLVALNKGLIRDCSAEISISSTSVLQAGGLVGINFKDIFSSRASGSIRLEQSTVSYLSALRESDSDNSIETYPGIGGLIGGNVGHVERVTTDVAICGEARFKEYGATDSLPSPIESLIGFNHSPSKSFPSGGNIKQFQLLVASEGTCH